MSKTFSNNLLFDNISFLLKTSGKKVGELESAVGVSTGYIARTSRDVNAKPGVDFVYNVAEFLDVSVDALLTISLAKLSPTELYLASLIDKLGVDTTNCKLEWNREEAKDLNNQRPDDHGQVNHPLFSKATFDEVGTAEVPFCERVTRVTTWSKSYGYQTDANGAWFNLRLKNAAHLYITNIHKSASPINDPTPPTKELWLCQDGRSSQFLCGTLTNAALAGSINTLYKAVLEYLKRPHFEKNVRYILDAFMNDDFEDDDDELLF